MTDLASAARAHTGVAANVERARGRIARAAQRSGRGAEAVRLVAVSKTVSPSRVLEAIAAGVADVGENKVQEALAKRDAIGEAAGGVAWHLIGHLQTNKAGRAAGGAFATVHSVDSDRVAQALDSRRPEELDPLDVLLEVELTGLPGRTGVRPEGLDALAELVSGGLPHLRLAGLMTMAPPPDGTGPNALDAARRAFARLRTLRDELEPRIGARLPELSMGMSGDFEVAVEEGSTIVRLGSALFGERPPRERRTGGGAHDA
ncbi:MAG TPA: YggS family pyridoxal phosphate-dependent enzyme [Candidatus Dormibacteraeota bacterium]|nr:YggS family pyridoxal phosphate-dependent enzyme [Candidatus Dormibacteraeota bacterium]